MVGCDDNEFAWMITFGKYFTTNNKTNKITNQTCTSGHISPAQGDRLLDPPGRAWDPRNRDPGGCRSCAG